MDAMRACAIGSGGLLLGVAASGTSAQTDSAVFTFENAWLLPDVSHPNDPPREMTGSFVWTYPADDFEAGSGELIEATFPWWGSDLSRLIEPDTIEITLNGSCHDLGFDMIIRFVEPLSMDRPSTIDPASTFEIHVGVSHRGHFQSGSAVPESPVCAADLTGDGTADSADFFAYLDLFAAKDPEADITGDGVIDGADFFAYLDLFASGC